MSSLDLATLLRIPQLSQHIDRVEKDMQHAVAADNPFLSEPVARLLAVRGKRLRPTLLIAAASIQTADISESVIAGCVAIELIHIASLVHDDIIDEAATRWNIPTISAKEGIGRAVLVGDYFLARATQQAATVNAEVAGIASSVIAELCEGQAYELADAHNIGRTMTSLLRAMRSKTAALMSASCRIGALCAAYTPEQVAALGRYGDAFGMAFQFLDDALDFLSTPELSGKPTGNDVREGTYTMPLILALGSPDAGKVKKLIDDPTDSARTMLVSLLLEGGYIGKTIAEARKYNQLAVNALRDFSHDATVTQSLSELPDAYLAWSLDHYTADIYQSTVAAY